MPPNCQLDSSGSGQCLIMAQGPIWQRKTTINAAKIPKYLPNLDTKLHGAGVVIILESMATDFVLSAHKVLSQH